MSLLEVLKRWWASDRIRVSPDVGHHLLLQPGQRVILDDRLMIVAERTEDVIAGKSGVLYILEPYHDDESQTCSPGPPWIWDPMAAEESVKIESRGDRIWIECFYESPDERERRYG